MGAAGSVNCEPMNKHRPEGAANRLTVQTATEAHLWAELAQFHRLDALEGLSCAMTTPPRCLLAEGGHHELCGWLETLPANATPRRMWYRNIPQQTG